MQGGSGRQSEPSGGISAFRGGLSNDGAGETADYGVGIPTDKFVVADATSDMISLENAKQSARGADE